MPTTEGTFGQVVAMTEAALFVGRTSELDLLQEAWETSRPGPVVAYVHGPTGIGKSAFLRACGRLAAARGAAVVALEAAAITGGRETFARDLAVGTELATRDDPVAIEEAVGAVNDIARERGLVVLLDGYDEVRDHESWLRSDVFTRLGPGSCVVLAGRIPPYRLWSTDLAWRSAVVDIPLAPLPAADADAFLSSCGVEDARCRREACAISGGHPLLLVLAANALTSQVAGDRTRSADGVRIASFLLEHLLHPGSKRQGWRAGAGSADLDALLAVAALLPSFEREILNTMIGRRCVDSAWARLIALPVIAYADGRYVIPASLRERLQRVILRERPWAERLWRRRAVGYHASAARADRTDADGGQRWRAIADLAREAPWYGLLHPTSEAEGEWQCGSGVTPGDLEALITCGSAATGEHADIVRRLLAGRVVRDAGGFVVARKPDGSVAGYVVMELLGARNPSGLPAPLRTWSMAGNVLHWRNGAWTDPTCVPALAREALAAVTHHRRVVVTECAPELQTVLAILGFTPVEGLEETWTIDWSREGLAPWLERVGCLLPEGVKPPDDWAKATKDVLMALSDPEELVRTAAADWYVALGGSRVPSSIRRWVLDALSTAELGESPVSGRMLLTTYYVQRVGTHEALAEQLGLPRATYFRWHRQTLERLGECLFG